MPVRITCSSGHAMSVLDEHVGSRVRCPECQETFRASADGQAVAGSHVTSVFTCEAGHEFRAPIEAAGQCVGCPTCGQVVRIPASGFKGPRPAGQPSDVPAGGVTHMAARPVLAELPTEKLWPVVALLGTAVAALVSIAYYLRTSLPQ